MRPAPPGSSRSRTPPRTAAWSRWRSPRSSGSPTSIPRCRCRWRAPALDGSPIATVEVDGVDASRPPPAAAARAQRRAGRAGRRGRSRDIGEVVARIGRALRGFFHPAAGRTIWWDQQHLPELAAARDASIEDRDRRELLRPRPRRASTTRVVPALPALRSQLIHNDVTLDNLLLDDDHRVTGIIDFGDMAHTALVLDVPATLQSLVRGRHRRLRGGRCVPGGYASVMPLEEAEAALHGRPAGRADGADDPHLAPGACRSTPTTSTSAAGRSRRGSCSSSSTRSASTRSRAGWRPSPARRRAAASVRRAPGAPASGAGHRARVAVYRTPLHLVRGDGAWLEAADGRRYLDAYNNVPVVGHAHPRVVEAIARQAATLNTNTRYLHEHVVELAERLVATMPDGLDTVLFVNSGCEANDLAWRLATTFTGADAGLVTAWGYHGVTAAIADLTASEWPDGEQPAGVETFAAPDTYRGRYADASDPASVARAEVVGAVARLADRGRRPGGAVRRLDVHRRRHLRARSGGRGRDRGGRARCRRPVRRRRGPVGPRPHRRDLGLRALGRRPRTSSRSASRWATATRSRP